MKFKRSDGTEFTDWDIHTYGTLIHEHEIKIGHNRLIFKLYRFEEVYNFWEVWDYGCRVAANLVLD